MTLNYSRPSMPFFHFTLDQSVPDTHRNQIIMMKYHGLSSSNGTFRAHLLTLLGLHLLIHDSRSRLHRKPHSRHLCQVVVARGTSLHRICLYLHNTGIGLLSVYLSSSV